MSQFLKITLRNLLNQKTSTAINLMGLTLGITACMVIYIVTHHELSYDRFHPDADRIYRVVGNAMHEPGGKADPIGFGPRAMPAALRTEISGIETVATFHNITSSVLIPNGGPTPKRIEPEPPHAGSAGIVIADPQYFDLFKYKWLAGSPQTALSAPNQVVLTHSRAKTYFGDIPVEAMMGNALIYRDKINTTVTGIVADFEENSDLAFTDFISLATINASELKREINLEEWNDIWSASQAFVKLAPGVTPEQMTPQLADFSERHFGPDKGTGNFIFTPVLQPLSDLHFSPLYHDNYSRQAHLPTLYGLIGIAAFILLMAAINFVNMATARSAQRARITGIRKVLGGTRSHLIVQMMGETLVLALLASGLSMLLVNPALSALKNFIPEGIQYAVFSTDVMVFLVGITLVTTLLSGLYPAWVLSSFQPAATLKGSGAMAGHQKGYFRKGLIVFQFTFSLFFIIGTIIVGRQMQFIRDKDLGFDKDAVVLIDTEHDDKSGVLAQKIGQLPGVSGVTMQWFAPMGENYMVAPVSYRNGSEEKSLTVSFKVGDANFIPMYGLNLIAGRNYQPSDSLKEFVINAAFAKAMGYEKPEDAVGQLLLFSERDYPISGVVADFHEQSLHSSIGPVLITHLPQMSKNIGVKLSTQDGRISDATKTLERIAQQWAAVYPGKAFRYTFLDDSIAKVYDRDQKTAQLVNGATAMAILVSCLGLFGLVSFTTEQRTKEISVRKVLGAPVASLVALLTKDFIVLVLIALVIASPLAFWAADKWLRDFVYRIDIQWWMFALAGVAAVLIAFFTVAFQSIKTAMVNPVDTLRNE